jgi:uncharacterized membrane protein YgcG
MASVQPIMISIFFKNKIVLLGLLGILFGLPSLPIKADEISNETPNISIVSNSDATTKKITIKYFITEKFNKPSRGVFLALPKNQDGVWTEYSVKKVIKAESNEKCDLKCAETLDWNSEKYELINEWNQFRIRIGDKNVYINPGFYSYGLEVEADYNPNVAYNFVFLNDWKEKISLLSLKYNGKMVCGIDGLAKVTTNPDAVYLNELYPDSKNVITEKDLREYKYCDKTPLQVKLNSDKPNSSILISILLSIWPYFLMFIIINGLLFAIWYYYARDEWGKQKLDRPEFEEPKLLPWQASYLVDDGQFDVKNILLSYILWLNHKKIIKIEPIKEESKDITISLHKALPTNNYLPAIFNETVEAIAKKGINEGVLSTKISPSTHLGEVQDTIKLSLSKYYDKKPLNSPILWTLLYGFIVYVLGAITFSALQSLILLGNSWSSLLLGAFVSSLPGVYFIFAKWAKLNNLGLEITGYCRRYKYYLEHVEMLKLDFSNNPKDGIQKYLVSVPFAASFGILPKYQKYFGKLIPDTSEVNNVNSFYTSYAVATFYTPPSDSSGGGGGGGGFSGGGGSW